MEQIMFIAILCFMFIEFLLAKKLCKDPASQSEKIYIPIMVKLETYYHYGMIAKDLAFDNLSDDKQRQIKLSVAMELSRCGYDLNPMNHIRYYESVWNHMKKIS